MRLKSRGLGRKELVMDFREYTVTRVGDEVVIEGTIHEPVHWDFSIRMCEDDLPGIAKVAMSKRMIGFLLKSAFKRNRDSHWSVSRKEHLEAVRAHAEEAKEAAAKKEAEAEAKAQAAAGGPSESKSPQDKDSKSSQDKDARTAKRIPDSVRNRSSAAREAAAKKDKPSVSSDADKPTKSVTFGRTSQTPGVATPGKPSSDSQGEPRPGKGSPSGNGSEPGNGSSSHKANTTSTTTDAPSVTTGTTETTTKVKEGNGS